MNLDLEPMQEVFPTLYKKDSTGKTRIWCMELNGNTYRTIAGVKDGQLVTSEWTTCAEKNVGRANATTAEEQALAEIEAQYKKKLSVDYFESEDNIDEVKVFKPMLAVDWMKRKAKLKWEPDAGTMIQPKLDGIRCIASKHGLFSRNGKPIVAVPHIEESLIPFFKLYPDHVLDGELYNHDLKADFNKIVSLVRKTKPKAADLVETSEKVQYHIYDVAAGEAGDFRSRDEFLSLALLIRDPMIATEESMLRVVPSDLIFDEEACDQMHGKYIADGYEGSIIRLNTPYAVGKRSNNLMKRKDFDDEEMKIVGYELGNGNFAGLPKVLKVDMGDGTIADATMTGTREYLKEVLDNFGDYIGKEATVQYFGKTPSGALRFPVVKALHKNSRI